MTINPVRQPAGIPVGGRFANKPQSAAAGVTLGSGESTNGWIRGRIESRDEIRETLNEAEDARSPEMQQLDRVYQHASIQLAAAAVLRDYPGADTLVLRENEEGENQYDLLAVRDVEGNDIVNTEADSDWTRNEIGGENSPQLDELCWALDPEDNRWVRGMGRITEDARNGRTAEVNLRAAVDRQAPPRTVAAQAAAVNYAAAQEQMEHLRQQTRMVQEINDHASMQLVAAGLQDKYPGAERLTCSRDIETGGRLEIVAVLDGEGNVLADPVEDKALSEDDLLGGSGPSVRTLMQHMDPDNLGWASSIAEVRSNRYETRFDIDLTKAMNSEGPGDKRLKDPRTRPLTAQQQSDLVQAAGYGLTAIRDAADGAENSQQEDWYRQLAERTDDALGS